MILLRQTIAIAGAILLCAPATWVRAKLPDQVAEVFQRRCLSCHNNADRKGDFSLQTAQQAFADDYIIAGDSRSSHLMDLIRPVDATAQMPKDSDPLSKSEIDSIRKWIDDGASWPKEVALSESKVTDFDWWSYQPLQRPSIPDPQDDGDHPIDRFIRAKWLQNELIGSPPADRRTLIRRLTYDLIGLPPSPDQVDAFVQSKDANAYDQLVDRLLDSPQHGERWARHWLDVVKYADTCGYDKDKLRPNAWPYRDYVIRSLNEDKPYWRFVQEQIAGDVLFPNKPDGILGLGFIAAGPWDFIGHVEVPESKLDGKVARNLDRDDMVSNTINTFCSLTVQCARCHNHKFDPISQADYYGLQSIFAAVDRANRIYDLDPAIEKRRSELETSIAKLRANEQKINQQIAVLGGNERQELSTQIANLEGELQVEKTPAFGFHSQFANSEATPKWVQIDLGSQRSISGINLYPNHDDFGGIGAGFGFPVRFKIQISMDGGNWETVADHTKRDRPNPGLSPFRVDGLSTKARFVRVDATKLFHRKDKYMLSLAEVVVEGSKGDNIALHQKVESPDSIEAPVRWARKNLVDGQWANWSDKSAVADLARLKNERSKLIDTAEMKQLVVERDQLAKGIADIQRKIKKLPAGELVYAAATQFKPQGQFKPTSGNLRAIHVLHRGNIDSPGDEAIPGTIPMREGRSHHLSPTDDEAQRRAQLARWLTDKDHPLVWRSIVNRVWQYHFGQGIVSTPNDFGRMGAKPTHPELLDWLAVEFRDRGQSLKQLHRMIVTSETYKQSSAIDGSASEQNHARDSGNQSLWRMNRRRLSAEEIRDSILSISGALDLKRGRTRLLLVRSGKNSAFATL